MKSIRLDLPYKVQPAKDGNRRNSRDLTSIKGDLMGSSCFVIVGAGTSNNYGLWHSIGVVHWIFRVLECYTYCILFDIVL